ncbi:MAG: VWA domain-containing protein [Spirosomataceae bacterium]
MFLDFYLFLREKKFPASITEYLTLLEALDNDVVAYNAEDFYFLCRTVLVKSEQFLDQFDVLFGQYFKGVEKISAEETVQIAASWLTTQLEREFTEEEKEAINAMGGLEKLLERLQQLLDEQKDRHEGGNRWIGTNGTSPFGNSGFNPEGIKIGQGKGGSQKAVKVWENRQYQNYDEDLELNTRNMKMALRRLRILTREGLEDELDLDGTIEETCKNGGLLDIQMQPARRNRVKVLLLLDVGGSMDEYIDLCSQLFSAAKYQFKHIEHLYFHNCIYETLWKDNTRRHERISTWEVLHKYNQDYKVIIVGDASMATYEITHPRGSIEHYNEEAGMVWLERLSNHFKNVVWLNPTVAGYWQYTPSIKLIRDWTDNRMFPLTISGLTQAMKCLRNSKIRFEA